MHTPKSIKPFLDRPVAVLGYGVSGRALVALLRARGIWFETYDERVGAAENSYFGPEQAAQHSLVLFSPGFAPEHPWLAAARRAGCKLMGELDFAALFWSGALIAVTGTNGKTTTTDFLTYAFKRADIPAISVGNIGYPVSRLHEVCNSNTTTAVCEISSYQAESIQQLRLQALIWTNFAEDHLERYRSMRDYFAAKWRLVECLSRPRLFVGRSVADFAEVNGFTLPRFAQVVDVDDDIRYIPADSCLRSPPQRENFLLIRRYWMAEGHNPDVLADAARQFEPPRHRLAMIDTGSAVQYWNDSKATNFASALAALRSFDRPVHWIAGGKPKGGDIEAFAQAAAPMVAGAYLIGEAAPLMSKGLGRTNARHAIYASLEDATAAAMNAATSGDIVLLSPGFASLDQFSGYAERGIRYEQAVLGLLSRTPKTKHAECAAYTEKSL